MAYPTALDGIGLKYQTDKSSADHDYLSFYEERLGHLTGERFSMLEIGIFRGGSLKTWGEYFPNAEIVGLDIDPGARDYAGDNRHVFIGDASRSETADFIVEKHGRPLIVLDDGSHIWHHQIESLRYFWPKILPGGYFIMEDLHTSMPLQITNYPWYQGDSAISAYDYILQLNRHVVGAGNMGDERPYDGFIGNYAPTIRSIEWYRRTCIIRKKLDVVEPPLERKLGHGSTGPKAE